MTKEGAAALLSMGAAHATLVGWVLAGLAVLGIVICLLMVRVGLRERRKPRLVADAPDYIAEIWLGMAVGVAVATGLAAYHALTFLHEPMYWSYIWLFGGK